MRRRDEQAEMDVDDLRAVLANLCQIRRNYESAKDTVRALAEQLRRAKCQMKEANLRMIAAEMRLSTRFGTE